MKKFALLMLAMACALVGCGQNFDPTAGCDVKYTVPEYVEPSWENDNGSELCPVDQWLRISDLSKENELTTKLIDAYNALMVFHSVNSDDDLFLRTEESTEKGMRQMDTKIINDTYTRKLADEFRLNMAKSQKNSTVNADDVVNNYLGALVKIYNLEAIMGNDSIFSEEKYDEATNHDYLRRDSFCLRCVEAIELAHQLQDGRPNDEALPLLVDVLTAGQYSPLLFEAWMTWRAMISMHMGHSKDSYIPNAEYNRLRMIACYTMICHIADYPDDWVAINNFLLMASKPNIAIFGPYPYGNQSVIAFYEMFPELLPSDE